jgi:AraC-like DNA-binding protein
MEPMTRAEADAQFMDYGLSCFSYRPTEDTRWRASPPHTHLELELVLVESGWVLLDVLGREERVEPGQLVGFWGGIPHRVLDADAAVVGHVAQIPIVDVLSWIASPRTVDLLLSGRVLRSGRPGAAAAMEAFAFGRWTDDLASGSAFRRAAAQLEIQARLHRLVDEGLPPPRPDSLDHGPTAGIAAAAIRFIVRHFMEDITVEDVATAVGRSRDHVMQCFRKVCGVTLWEYVTRVRVNEARRLLAVTDLPILAVCHRAGFNSTSRMYDAFHRHCGLTPGQLRRRSTVEPLH